MLPTVVNLALQIQRDAQHDEQALRRRDRDLGVSLRHLSATPVQQLIAWLRRVSVEDDRRTAQQAVRAMRLTVLVLCLVGSVTGSGAAAAAFYYNGQQPINILPVLAVFVVLPVVMLLPFSLAVLPRSWLYRCSLLADLQASLSLMLAGLMGLVTRLLSQPYREALQQAAGRSAAYRRVYGYMQKWMLLQWSQTFTIAFMLGAVAWFSYRLVVTDLAFTWSTTLQTEQPEALYHRVQRLTDILAWPWANILPQAQPSAQLIRDTHYFRLQSGVLADHVDPARLGGWWPFLMLSMVCYGLLPRILTLAFCVWRYRVASRWCLLHTPGAAEVLERLNGTLIETRSPTDEATAAPQPASPPPTAPGDQRIDSMSQALVINWSAVPVSNEQACQLVSQQLTLTAQPPLHAGGRRTLDEDAGVIAHIATALHQAQAESPLRSQQVMVLVKAWEPPMMEVVDFLRELRQAVGDGLRIVVLALSMPPNAASEADTPRWVEQWQHKLVTIGDPWLQVRPLTLPADLVQADNSEAADAKR